MLAKGEIFQIKPDLGPRRLPARQLYVTKEAKQWLDQLSTEFSGNSLLSERAEVEAIFAEFVAGQPLTDLVEVNPPAGEGIKKLKTTRFRMWGWAYGRQIFILTNACTKKETKEKLVRERDMGQKALNIRNGLGVFSSAKGHWSELFPSEK